MRDRSAGGSGLVLSDNPKSLLAAIIPCNLHCGAELNPIMIFGGGMTRAVALRETLRDADAKAARSPEFCAAAYAVRAAATSTSIRAAPSGVTSFWCSEICRYSVLDVRRRHRAGQRTGCADPRSHAGDTAERFVRTLAKRRGGSPRAAGAIPRRPACGFPATIATLVGVPSGHGRIPLIVRRVEPLDDYSMRGVFAAPRDLPC